MKISSSKNFYLYSSFLFSIQLKPRFYFLILFYWKKLKRMYIFLIPVHKMFNFSVLLTTFAWLTFLNALSLILTLVLPLVLAVTVDSSVLYLRWPSLVRPLHGVMCLHPRYMWGYWNGVMVSYSARKKIQIKHGHGSQY